MSEEREEYKFDHFKNIDEVMYYFNYWYKEEDVYSINRYLSLKDFNYISNKYQELQKENKQLKIQISAREEVCDRLEINWNKLKEWVNKNYDYYMNNEDYIGGRLCFTDIKNKIQELEQGSDSDE